MERLSVENFGPIRSADVNFGDLTLLVGAQASGKSLFLELFKLAKDKDYVVDTLCKYNYVLPKTDAAPTLDYYFGEGLHSLLSEQTEIQISGKKFTKADLLNTLETGQEVNETVFYVPAQRILSISDGRPKNFMEFDGTTPFVLRNFSETLRLFLQTGMGNPDVIFPIANRLEDAVKNSIEASIFHGAEVIIDQSSGQRKMKLNVGKTKLPFITWSAGQKEFMPLLLATYCLFGPTVSAVKKENYKWVVIEEPEMGLHPKAIQTVLLQIIALMRAGYKVIVSTHSTTLLEFAWLFETLKQLPAEKLENALCELFSQDNNDTISSVFNHIQGKEIKTYFFASQSSGVVSTDISSLDVEDVNPFIAEWGGLSAFAGKASEVVAKYYE